MVVAVAVALCPKVFHSWDKKPQNSDKNCLKRLAKPACETETTTGILCALIMQTTLCFAIISVATCYTIEMPYQKIQSNRNFLPQRMCQNIASLLWVAYRLMWALVCWSLSARCTLHQWQTHQWRKISQNIHFNKKKKELDDGSRNDVALA